MSKPIYTNDLTVPRLPISGDRESLIRLYQKKIANGLKGIGKLTDGYFSWLSHFHEMENNNVSAREILDEGLSWFPNSQLLMASLLRLLWFEFERTPQTLMEIQEILGKLKPDEFGAPEKAFFESFYDSLVVEKKPELERMISTANSVIEQIGRMERPHHYNCGWELDFSDGARTAFTQHRRR